MSPDKQQEEKLAKEQEINTDSENKDKSNGLRDAGSFLGKNMIPICSVFIALLSLVFTIWQAESELIIS